MSHPEPTPTVAAAASNPTLDVATATSVINILPPPTCASPLRLKALNTNKRTAMHAI